MKDIFDPFLPTGNSHDEAGQPVFNTFKRSIIEPHPIDIEDAPLDLSAWHRMINALAGRDNAEALEALATSILDCNLAPPTIIQSEFDSEYANCFISTISTLSDQSNVVSAPIEVLESENQSRFAGKTLCIVDMKRPLLQSDLKLITKLMKVKTFSKDKLENAGNFLNVIVKTVLDDKLAVDTKGFNVFSNSELKNTTPVPVYRQLHVQSILTRLLDLSALGCDCSQTVSNFTHDAPEAPFLKRIGDTIKGKKYITLKGLQSATGCSNPQIYTAMGKLGWSEHGLTVHSANVITFFSDERYIPLVTSELRARGAHLAHQI